MIISAVPDGKVRSEDIIAGYISNNLIYESNKSEENNQCENIFHTQNLCRSALGTNLLWIKNVHRNED